MKQIDEKVLYEKYKEIMRVCLTSGTLIPYMISPACVPSHYIMTDEEQMRVLADTERLREEYVKRRNIELGICEGDGNTYSSLSEYWMDELIRFVKKYPQFEDIITEE